MARIRPSQHARRRKPVRRITRYIIAEFFKAFLTSLILITLVVVLLLVGHQAVRQGLGPGNLVRLIPYMLPIALLYAVPATALFAACSVFGRISSENEFVAVKSLGISPLHLIRPALLLSLVLSLVVVALNDLAVTWGRDGLRRVVLESVEQIAYGMLRTQRSYRSRRFSITVKRVQQHRLIRPTLTFHMSDDRPPIVIVAEEAELWANLEQDALSIALTNWEVDDAESGRFFDPGQRVIHVPLSDAAYKTESTRGISDIALRQIPREVDRHLEQIGQLEESLAAEAAYQLMTGDFHALLAESWEERHDRLAQARGQLHRLHTEPWRRWANGFSCLAFVLVGAPLAVRMRNADMWTTFGLCFGVLLLIYYPLLAYGVDLAKSGTLPPYSVWAGNVVLACIGAWLLTRVVRY